GKAGPRGLGPGRGGLRVSAGAGGALAPAGWGWSGVRRLARWAPWVLGELGGGAKPPPPTEVLAGGFAEGAQRLFQALLLGSVGRPVPAPQRVLGTVPDLPRPLPELTRRRRVERRRGRRPRSARRARGVTADDAGERLLERRLHRDLVAVGDDHAPEL